MAERLADLSHDFRGRPQPDPRWNCCPFREIAARHWSMRDRLYTAHYRALEPLPCTCARHEYCPHDRTSGGVQIGSAQ
jgi:hypothetical protein